MCPFGVRQDFRSFSSVPNLGKLGRSGAQMARISSVQPTAAKEHHIQNRRMSKTNVYSTPLMSPKGSALALNPTILHFTSTARRKPVRGAAPDPAATHGATQNLSDSRSCTLWDGRMRTHCSKSIQIKRHRHRPPVPATSHSKRRQKRGRSQQLFCHR